MTNSPQQLVAVLGRGVVETGSQVVTADDLGFTRGDGVFDAMRVVVREDGTKFAENIDRHLARFARSIAGVDGPELDEQPWRDLIAEALEVWDVPGEAVLKIMWSKGQETQGGEPLGVFTITQMSQAALAERAGISLAALERGTSSTTFNDAPWLLGGVKSLAYAINVASKREAKRRGADDVLFMSSDGFCLEGPTSSLIVLKDGELITTPTGGTGILASITQAMIFENAEADGITCHTRLMTLDEVLAADAVWFVSSVRGACPITAIDGQRLAMNEDWTNKLRDWARF